MANYCIYWSKLFLIFITFSLYGDELHKFGKGLRIHQNYSFIFFSNIYWGKEDFLTFNTFSLYVHIGLTVGLEVRTKDP